ncbi:MAG: ABC transporter substrate-binding protein [Chloroflexota bacterium]
MTKKFSFRFVVIMLSLLTIVGINAALAQEEKTLVIGINAAPASLDALHEGGSIVNIRHYGMIYDTLVRTMADASLAPMLATEWSTEDGQVWVFQLREGVILHDGSTMTADDVVYSLDRVLAGEFPGSAQSQMAPYIAGVEATGDLEVTITATQVDPNMPMRLASTTASIVPAEATAAAEYEDLLWAPIGSGPFKVAEYIEGDRLVLEAHDDYWMGAPDVDTVIIRYIPEDATRIAALQSGDVDFITTIQPDQVAQVEETEGLFVDTADVLNFMQVLINTNQAPLDDVNVRRAMSLSIDREVLVNDLWSGYNRTMNEYLMPGEFGYDPELDLFPYDPDAARAALEEAGYNGEPITFIAPVTYYTNMSIISDALFAFWSEVGLNVDYQRVETEAWRNNLRGGGPGITIVSAGSTGDPGLRSDFRGWFEGNYADDQWTPTDEYTDLWDTGSAALDLAERERLFRDLITIIDEEVLIIPMYQSVEFYGRRDGINWEPNVRFAIDLRPDVFSMD